MRVRHSLKDGICDVPGTTSVSYRTTVSANSMRLAGEASVPAGGPFMVLLPAGGPFIYSPLVHNTSVPVGGLFVLYSTSQLTFCWKFGDSCSS